MFVYYFFLFSDHLCICTYKFVVVYLHAVIFITAIISELQGRQFLLQPQSRQQFFASIFFVWLRAIMCYNNVCLGHSCWLNVLFNIYKYCQRYLKIFQDNYKYSLHPENEMKTSTCLQDLRTLYRLIPVHLKVKYIAREEQK